jgi:RNA polymerase sigma factor (sigma-70 family)
MSPRLSDALLRSQSDERLVALAGEGHERAFTTLVERHRKPLVAFARRLADEDRGEDVVQQGLMQAWAALRSGTEVTHVRGWLYEIVRRAAWKATARTRDAHPLGLDVAGGVDPAAAAEDRESFDDLVARVADLPVRQREALLQMTVGGHSRDEVAGRLGVSAGAVRQLVHRARTTLRTAATAVTPWPLVAWAARGSAPGGMSDRMGDLVAGAGSAGAGALAKGAVVVVATGAVSVGVVEHGRRSGDRPARPAAIQVSERDRSVAPAGPAGAGLGARPQDVATRPGSGDGARGRGRDDARRRGSRHGGQGRGGEHPGPVHRGGPGPTGGRGEDGGRSGGSGRPGSGDDGSRPAGSGRGGADRARHGDDGSGSREASSGSGGTSGDSHSGSGSGSDGSGSDESGSGTGAEPASSGSSGHGSSPLGTSGSSNGPGSSDVGSSDGPGSFGSGSPGSGDDD